MRRARRPHRGRRLLDLLATRLGRVIGLRSRAVLVRRLRAALGLRGIAARGLRGIADLEQRPRSWRVGVTIALSALVVGGALWGRPLAARIAAHPYFAITEIVVAPTSRVRPGALLEWAELRPGLSIWSVDPARLAARLEAHPWIRRASVRREFPRRLLVRVAERQPAAVLLLDHLYYIDRSGVVFARLGLTDAVDLPLLTGVEAAILAGEGPYPRHAIRRALKLLQLMRVAGLPFRVSEVHMEREQGVTVFPVAPRVALRFGWSRFPGKLERLKEVLGAFADRETQIREIDLTYGAQAVIRLRSRPRGGRPAGA